MERSDYFILGSALVSMILSIFLWFMVDKEAGLFVGLWVPSLLGFGTYIKKIYGGNNGWLSDIFLQEYLRRHSF